MSKVKEPEHTLETMVRESMTKYKSVKTLKKYIVRGELEGVDTAPPGSKYSRIVCTESAIERFNAKLKSRRSAAESLRSRQEKPEKKKRNK